jgi:DNA-binding GntR family transcriptional regulator
MSDLTTRAAASRGTGGSPRPADRVYRALLGRLLSREIQPGARINIDAASRAWDVSQTPVREALAQLEIEGLVSRVHLAGFRAAPLLAREQFDDLFEVRDLLEPHAANRAAGLATAAELRQMEEVAGQMRLMAAAIEPATYPDFALADGQLHELIAAASGNALLHATVTRLHPHVHLFRLQYHPQVSLDAIAEHDEVLAAIAEGRPAAAHRAMREHLRASQARLSVAFAPR